MFLALLVGGCSFWLYRSVRPVVDEANDFMADMAAGDATAAAEHTSDSSRCFDGSAVSQLESLLDEYDPESYNLIAGSVNTGTDGTTGEAGGLVTFADGSESEARIPMIKEGDDWKVCGVNFDAPTFGSNN